MVTLPSTARYKTRSQKELACALIAALNSIDKVRDRSQRDMWCVAIGVAWAAGIHESSIPGTQRIIDTFDETRPGFYESDEDAIDAICDEFKAMMAWRN